MTLDNIITRDRAIRDTVSAYTRGEITRPMAAASLRRIGVFDEKSKPLLDSADRNIAKGDPRRTT